MQVPNRGSLNGGSRQLVCFDVLSWRKYIYMCVYVNKYIYIYIYIYDYIYILNMYIWYLHVSVHVTWNTGHFALTALFEPSGISLLPGSQVDPWFLLPSELNRKVVRNNEYWMVNSYSLFHYWTIYQYWIVLYSTIIQFYIVYILCQLGQRPLFSFLAVCHICEMGSLFHHVQPDMCVYIYIYTIVYSILVLYSLVY